MARTGRRRISQQAKNKTKAQSHRWILTEAGKTPSQRPIRMWLSFRDLDLRFFADPSGKGNRDLAQRKSVSGIIEEERLSVSSSETRFEPFAGCASQEKSSETVGRDEKKSLRDNFELLSMDEVRLDLDPPWHACWMKRGEQKTIPALQPRTKKHRHIFGAYSWNTDCISWRVVDWKNTQTFLEFIEYLLVECYPTGRIVLVIWLPPYCPELHLIERYWRHLKDLACANKLHSSIEEVAASTEYMLAQ